MSNNRNRQPGNNQPRRVRQPFWKEKVIQLLRGTIGILENTVTKLEQEETREIPRSGFWGKIPSILPGIIIAGVAVVVIWRGTNLFHQQTNPEIEPTPIASISTLTPEATPENPIPEETIPPEVEPTPEAIAQSTPEPTPEPTPEITAVETPVEPETIPEITPLTPEQNLIAAIENQIANISDRIAQGMVKSIQVNFASSTLSVKLSDDWYNLSTSEQDEIATDIWLRSQDLDFTHLEIMDMQDHLIARNPVVGTQIIVLQRHA
ncbi:hypothetical protein [Calothrix sp. NIES-3974]|uniref:hypothetical protein n=1 Tax=Calothrix sp. NIES-3974 TaxID=2005462 RepID=UPI000B60B944|nr:hypothetical protein [Calothrix sp. NIES-3974]BAZ06839.1 hypothetical protein NIES3974_35010 [Calothrix sp. NIES-3974]